MTFEFDHLFICTDTGASEGDRLVAFGLAEGLPNTHPGQGTANRRFFFHNAMLELLWVYDPEAAQSELICPTRLWERWRDRHQGACPLGICLRPAVDAGDGNTGANTVAFPSWDYHPLYLPPTLRIAVGQNSHVLTEPMLFQVPFSQRPDQYAFEKVQPVEHPVGFREITRVEIVSPTVNCPSPELQAVLKTEQVTLSAGSDYCIELGFDGEAQGQHVDFRPGLPLILRW
jgi:hypothetical protein